MMTNKLAVGTPAVGGPADGKHTIDYLAVLVFVALFFSTASWAAGKKRSETPSTPDLVRVIEVDPIANRYIELPDPKDPLRFYGENIYNYLLRRLNETKKFRILSRPIVSRFAQTRDTGTHTDTDTAAVSATGVYSELSVAPDPILIDLPLISSTHINIKINELSFSVGTAANKIFYGFKRGHENAYNAGVDLTKTNEFPLRIGDEASWFEKEFKDTGGLHTGLDLGHEINFDLLLVGANLKRALYKASMGLLLTFNDYVSGKQTEQPLLVKASGYYYDFSGHLVYPPTAGIDYQLGMTFARKAALYEAFKKITHSVSGFILEELQSKPLIVRLAALDGGTAYISAGANLGISPGNRFYNLTQFRVGQPPSVYTVESVYQKSSQVRIEGVGYKTGDELVSLKPDESVPQPRQMFASRIDAPEAELSKRGRAQEIELTSQDIPIPKKLKQYEQSYFERFIAGIKQLLTLPYRIWRYFQYDQKFLGKKVRSLSFTQALEIAKNSWALQRIGARQAWQQVGLGDPRMIVAIIDSGIDYNHSELNENIYWDAVTKRPGWDFISWDSRPFDDHAHGTEVASVVAGGKNEITGVAPNITLMPIKIFSPYGVTSSSGLYSGFEYAIANGAKIIVVAWATEKQSQALRDAISLAEANGVLVVTSAGDQGYDLDKQMVYPAEYAREFKNLLVVSGTSKEDTLLHTENNSTNYGSLVHLTAPAEDILIARPRGNYASQSHTGLATGFVAGAAALAWSICPRLNMQQIQQAFSMQDRSSFQEKALSVPSVLTKIASICK